MRADEGLSVTQRLRAAGVAPDAPDEDAVVLRGDVGAYEARDFLTRNRIPFRYEEGVGPLQVRLRDGSTVVAPSLLELAGAVGCHVRPDRDVYDLVVVGAGPAGLAACVYGAAEGLRVLAVEELAPGGQAGTSSLIENYPGFPDGVSGNDLADRTHRQAQRLGAEILLVHAVVDGGPTEDGRRLVVMEDGTEIGCGAVVCATGVDWRRLDAPGIDRLAGRGVYYGAATSEAPGVDGKDVLVVGGGNSAGQAALFFARWARHVTMVVRGPDLAATLSDYLLRRIDEHDDITVLTSTRVTGVAGDDWLRTATLTGPAGGTREVPVHAVFVCIGGVPRTQWAADFGMARDDAGYLVTGADLLAGRYAGSWPLERVPDMLETSQPRLYAVGDVRHGSTKRIATAMGEGALVVKVAQDRLSSQVP